MPLLRLLSKWCSCLLLITPLFLSLVAWSQTGLPAKADANTTALPELRFRSRATLIQVPVLVTEKNGAHVSGLGSTDFHIFENGVEQKVSSFEEIQVSKEVVPLPPNTPGMYTNQQPDAPEVLTLIAVDMANTPMPDQVYARAQLVHYLAKHIPPNQRIALVSISTSGLGIIHDVDSDPQALIRALQRADAGIPANQAAPLAGNSARLSSQSDFYNSRSLTAASVDARVEAFMQAVDASTAQFDSNRAIETTLRAFQAIAWSLSGVPGRKSLIWITDGMPIVRYSADAAMPGYLEALYQRAIHSLNDAQVALYPMSAAGLRPQRPIPTNTANPSKSSSAMNSRGLLADSVRASMEMLADQTGGRMTYNTNDLDRAFGSVAEDSGSYYLLSYYLAAGDGKPGWRSLKVALDRHGVEVRSRSGFFVTQGMSDPVSQRKEDLEFALVSPFNCTGVPVSVRLPAVNPGSASKTIPFALHLSPTSFTIDPDGNRFDLEFAAIVFKGGHNVAHTGQSFLGKLTDASLPKFKAKGLNYEDAFSNLSPGEYQVRFVVRDNLSGRVGSVSAPLVVN